ncbi:MAG: aminotransferase class III-fold pyridoxal phosphate-dependent enzyme, partial [Chloroflexi bacterium]|nr:aminotransferase class III-fold pyridoxal phosphate-dependent enzyme [Chloroflexota bacterium]
MPTTAERESAVFMMSAGRLPVTLVRGEGSRVWDDEGNEYLDFVAGIAADNLGHCHPRIVEAIKQQAETLLHVSNYFYTIPQLDLADVILEQSGMTRIFFCNSGAEATEGAIKIGRKWGQTRRDGATEIIVMDEAFHGRTLA